MWLAIKAFLSSNWLKVAQWGGIVFAVLGVLLSARKAGRDSERAKVAVRTAKLVEKAHEAENRVNAMPDSDVHKRLRTRWQR